MLQVPSSVRGSLFILLDVIIGDAAYSHMLLKMRFPKGFNFFLVRNENDNSYGRGIEIEKDDIKGFQVRFFTNNEIRDLTTAEGFEILWIKEEYEEPLFLVSSRKS